MLPGFWRAAILVSNPVSVVALFVPKSLEGSHKGMAPKVGLEPTFERFSSLLIVAFLCQSLLIAIRETINIIKALVAPNGNAEQRIPCLFVSMPTLCVETVSAPKTVGFCVGLCQLLPPGGRAAHRLGGVGLGRDSKAPRLHRPGSPGAAFDGGTMNALGPGRRSRRAWSW